MAYRKSRRRFGKKTRRHWGGKPSAAAIHKEVADPDHPGKPRAFDFVLVAVRLSLSDPRSRTLPTDPSLFFEDCRAAIKAKRVFVSLGHIPLRSRTVVLLIEYRGKQLKAPILRVYSSPSGWKRLPKRERVQ